MRTHSRTHCFTSWWELITGLDPPSDSECVRFVMKSSEWSKQQGSYFLHLTYNTRTQVECCFISYKIFSFGYYDDRFLLVCRCCDLLLTSLPPGNWEKNIRSGEGEVFPRRHQVHFCGAEDWQVLTCWCCGWNFLPKRCGLPVSCGSGCRRWELLQMWHHQLWRQWCPEACLRHTCTHTQNKSVVTPIRHQ